MISLSLTLHVQASSGVWRHGPKIQDSTTWYYDIISSIQLAKNLVFHARTKNIEVHYYYVHEKILASQVDLIYVNSKDQTTNIFIKALSAKKKELCRELLGYCVCVYIYIYTDICRYVYIYISLYISICIGLAC